MTSISDPEIRRQVELLMRSTTFADEVGLARPDADVTDGSARGLRDQMASELEHRLLTARKDGRPLRVYVGFDPTAASLHIGHLVAAYKLRQFQQLGHQVIFLIGDYTAMIGDPSGQAGERRKLTHEEAIENSRRYTDQAFRLLDAATTEIRCNGEWLGRLSFADLIELASLFPLKQIIARRDFQERLERGDSLRFHECLYALMQGYDAHALGCDVQVGGYDQHFNMLAGRIIQQHFGTLPHVMLTMPLLLGTDGRKMSKSYGNAILLDDSPADMYGKCMRIGDALIPQYLDLVTTLATSDVDLHKERLARSEVNPKEVKKLVAFDVTRQYHGEDGARLGEDTFRQLSELRQAPEAIETVSIDVGPDGLWLPKALVRLQLVPSAAEGRRMIAQGAVSLDGEKVTDADTRLMPADGVVIKVGKRRFLRVTAR
jgi:tyrosyl-tRNA synthetase